MSYLRLENMLMHELRCTFKQTLNSLYKTCFQDYYLAYCCWRARVYPKNNSIKMQITILT